MSLERVLAQIGGAEVTLVAVSKGRSVAQIEALHRKGVIDFAESRVAEALAKMEVLSSLPIRWHLIGTLQRNKIPKVVGRFALIQSIDGPEIAYTLAQAAEKRGVVQPILLQANTSGERSKRGLSAQEWEACFEDMLQWRGIEIRGLMTLAPLTEDEGWIRATFAGLRHLKERLQTAQLSILSMGMSRDFQLAIQEGATMVRIGSALFDENIARDAERE